MSAVTRANPHILVFPYPAQGHMLPLLDLTHQLSLHNLTITVVITPKNRPFLSPLLASHPSITPLVLPFPSHPSIPAGVEHVKDLGNRGNVPMVAALRKLHDPLVQWISSHPNPPVAIISDFFLGWTQRLAGELNIPRITFYSSGAFVVSVNSYLFSDVEKFKPLTEVEFEALPGSPVFKEEHLPSIFRFHRSSDPDWELVRDGMIRNRQSWGSVFNSFDALEGKYLDYLRREMGHDRVFGVGPLSLTGPDSSARGTADSNRNDRVLTWLDGCPDGSVVYVCFGSQKLLSREQMAALASGLEKSGTRFVWVVKKGTTQQTESGYGAVPDGFEERVAGRGRILEGWAPQVLILSHKAVGGFLSHCGWNSVMEAVVGGVMILAWPMEADQFVNARLLGEDMGVAVRVCEGADSVPDAEGLGRVVSESMKAGGEAKKKAKDLRRVAFAAVGEGGSSTCDLDRLVKELSQQKPK